MSRLLPRSSKSFLAMKVPTSMKEQAYSFVIVAFQRLQPTGERLLFRSARQALADGSHPHSVEVGFVSQFFDALRNLSV